MPTNYNQLRRMYAELIDTLVAGGSVEQAGACARFAAQQQVWRYPFQRPLHYVESLPLVTAFDPRKLWVVGYLERNFEEIRAEVERVSSPAAAGFKPVEEPLVDRGRWDQVVFYEGGRRFEQVEERFPRTSAIIDRIPAEQRGAGVIMLSWLHPGTHIAGHCGYTNGRLRIHLGIKTPPGARMRVHDAYLNWRAGECLVFDDSIEHEVWNEGTEPRVVMIFDVYHPALPPAEHAALAGADDAQERVQRSMKERGFRRLSLADGGLQVDLDRATELAIRRYLADSGLASIELCANGDLRTERVAGAPENS